MNPRRKNRLYLAVMLLIGLTLTASLVLYALRANIDLFYTPGEILYGKGSQAEKPQIGQRLRIGGMVMPGSVKRDPETLKVSFKLYDIRGAVEVNYQGILPDLFREGQGVVAQGILRASNLIDAREVLAKHDEKYTPPEIADAMKQNHLLMPQRDTPQQPRGNTP
ncbi:cytochrome c maturation protein CcmE [Serratia microhaemolytica]|uniref:cytochrome c maturation protein CcmE n=1 Tax=Serratia microhaemolytica TaxID=2675110 RepID=UPI000FDDB46C|nr:cytochrome c maturation protein CcmE [Serratia microhaemolytica]